MWKEVEELEGFFRRFLSLYRPLVTNLNDLLAPYQLSYSLWQVLFYLKNEGPSTLVDISNYYNVEKPTITRRVHRLEELQLVRQIPSKDRREKITQLTALGEEIYQTCRKKITDLENSVMEGIAKEEQEVAFHILPKIQHNIRNGEGNKSE
ncbi:helix turn helix multiple antibiotic resistance protein [Trichococcus palustris]|uniref:Helix turn helix multiple antibiotic resistance protein n=1 Tax=Trichococcus palustris TaxID=140314 RepID=A0A143YTA9_9LACT|nr:helix turn helix multiple antibiotic resistance protein [Trichococcus palustris]SFK95475.1 DNA-binding transcriptional regulator, MarR family [Trichococcus palustris]